MLDEQGLSWMPPHGARNCISALSSVSLQDMKGSKYFGGEYDKLRHLTELNWDVAGHRRKPRGVDTYKTDLAFDRIRRKFTLHLSGTPFKALANDKLLGMPSSAGPTPTSRPPSGTGRAHRGQQGPYQTSLCSTSTPPPDVEIIRDEIQQGRGGSTAETPRNLPFDLNEGSLKVKPNGGFEARRLEEWTAFLDAMTTQNKFPFSTPELRAELEAHLLAAEPSGQRQALAKSCRRTRYSRTIELILAAGDGKLDDTDENQKSFDRGKSRHRPPRRPSPCRWGS